MRLLVLAGAAVVGLHSPAFAVDPRYDVAILVEAPEGIEEDLDDVAPSTSVITRLEIQASEAVSVGDLLRRVPGVDVSRAGSAGKVTTVRLDGASSAQTLVLLDGMELNSPTLGLVDLADLSLDEVERIEVVRGPMSALYGSQAMGGVISIHTRRGTGRPVFEPEVSGGSYGTLRAAVRSRGAIGERSSYSVSLSRDDVDGRRFDTPAGPLEHDGWENTTLTGGVTFGLGEDSRLRVDGRYVDAGRDIPIEVFGAQAFDVNSTQDDRLGMVSARFNTRLGRLEPEFRFGLTDTRQDFDDPADPGEEGPFVSDFSARTDTLLTQVAAGADLVFALDRLSFGFEWERAKGENSDSFSGPVPNIDRTVDTLSFYAQNRLAVASLLGEDDELVLTAGVRVDYVDSFGTTASPKAQAVWTGLDGGLRLRGGAGRGFRAPSLNELYFPFFGNPDLDPEDSWTYEGAVGWRWLEGRVDAELRVFRSDYEDLITSDPATFTAVNLARARVTAAEVEARVRPAAGWLIRGAFTHQDAEDRASGEELLRRPGNKGSLSLTYERAERWRLAVDWIATGDQRDVPVFGFPEETPGWNRLDLGGAFTLPVLDRRFELFGRVENLFDEEYQELSGFPAPGINGRGGVRARF